MSKQLIGVFILILFFLSSTFDGYSVSAYAGGPDSDPFSSRKRSHSVKHSRGISSKQRRKMSKSKRKKFSLGSRQNSHQSDYSARMRSRGVRGGYNMTADAFSYKRKKKFKPTGKRGESFYKKKKRKGFKLLGIGGKETRRMDKASKKSFKK
ncbi:MAG: hypothetical protein J0M08_00730 [Bacteroidetes bacterium]|nr:hypothetical protein [Bacteroidota bacterium]